MQNIREREIQLLGKMLTLTPAGSAVASFDFNDQWKVLIYDQDSRDIISPLLNIGALRQKGVTLHLLLHSDREPIPDAPAVYFVRPTEENVKRIAEDCGKQLYRTVYLNFVTRIDRPLMEKLAADLVANGSVSTISKIYDQYLDVIALESNLFTLNIKNSFTLYNEPSLSEQQIRGFMTRVATGLLSTVRVLGTMPIIRCPSGGAAEMLSKELNSLLKENTSTRGPAQSLFEDCLVGDRSRPLLLIVDRASDFFPVLQHTSKYQALINDLLDSKLNRVTIEMSEKDGVTKKKKTYDLNSQADSFLLKYGGAPFPEAVDANEKELSEVSHKESAIRSGKTNIPASQPNDIMSTPTNPNLNRGKELSEAIESLPEILQQKMKLEAHTNVLQAVMKQIAKREIPSFFEIEQSILASGGHVSDKAAVLNLLKDSNKGLVKDKARLLALLAVSAEMSHVGVKGANNAIKQLNDEYDAAFKQSCPPNADGTVNPLAGEIENALTGVMFLRKLLSLNQSSSRMMGGAFGGSNSTTGLSSFLNSAHSRATSLMAKATSFFTKFTPFYVTRLVDNLAEGKPCPEDDTFAFFDPRARDNVATEPKTTHKYSDVIVFVLGGGSYAEFFNLQELLKEKSTSGGMLRHIMYGCTDLVAGDEFMVQLEKLGKPSVIA